MAFKGYLLKFKDAEFPMDCLVLSSYSCSRARHVWREWLDNNAGKHIDHAQAEKATISIDTEDYIEQDKVDRIQACLAAGLLNAVEQRYQVEFWDPSTSSYRTAEMHMEPINYIMLDIWDSGPVYEAIHIGLSEF